MAVFVLLLLFLAINTVTSQQTRQPNSISLGSALTPKTINSSWYSPSRVFAFGFYQQNKGYSIGVYIVSDTTIVWTANRDNPFVAENVTLALTSDGRLVLQQRGAQDVSVVSLSEPIASASMLDNGNFVLYNSSSGIIWQSFDHPTDTLLPGQRLLPGEQLFSSASNTDFSKGVFRLKMQTDGNLVQYPINTPDTSQYAYYSSGTNGAGNNVTLNLDNDGHLYLFNGSSILKNLTTGGYPTSRTIYLLRLDVDGIFRLYSRSFDGEGNWTALMSSTGDKCDPIGLCGLNSFCVGIDEAANCICLPGFDFVAPGNWSAGCSRNSTAEGCKSQSVITALDNVVWEDDSYAVLNTDTVENCRRACLDDCNCDVAFFENRQCSKQRLPLRYGRRKLSDPNTVLVKVNTVSEGTNGESGKTKARQDILIVGISLIVTAILITTISWIYFNKRYINAYKRISEYGDAKLDEDAGLRAFSYADLARATDDFKEELGKGSSGTVYRGVLRDSQKLVAVKRLENGFVHGDREFKTEMKVIGRTHHRNLVRLIGYCLEGPNRLLVFEYMSSGSLADVLFKQDIKLSWEERVQIACDIARGILYLHEECESQIIHCDIKPQNILMNEHRRAKISDFGLAKLLKQDQTNTYTGIRGTRGYVAPEWHQRQPVTVKADVYSFGIVLLEIICSRKSVDYTLSEDEAILEEWVYKCYDARSAIKLVGDEEVDFRKLERMVKIGLWCIQEEPSLRPTMKKVLLMLEGTVDIPVPPNPSSFLSSV